MSTALRSFAQRIAREGLLTAPREHELAWLPSWAVRCSLPAQEPSPGAVWQSRCGHTVLRIVPRTLGVGRASRTLGLPYGHNARLALAVLSTEILRQAPGGGSVVMGSTLRETLLRLGKSTSGGQRSGAKALRTQLERLLLSLILLSEAPGVGAPGETTSAGVESLLVPAVETELWGFRSEGEDVLKARLELNPIFVDHLRRHAVPVDLRVLRAFGRDVLAIDLFLFSSYRVRALRQPLRLGYATLAQQLGHRFQDDGKWVLNQRIRKAFEKIRLIYGELEVETNSKGIVLHPSPPFIAAASPPG